MKGTKQEIIQKHPWQPYAIFIGVLLILMSGSLLSEGIGSEGLHNSVVAQVLAEGYGKFWLPDLSISTSAPDLQGYLPVGYWMQAGFIKLFGNSLLGDKLYSILIFVLCAIVIDRIWHLLGFNTRTDWIPLVFWIMSPIVPWSATNNLLEGPLTLFVLLSIYLYFIALISSMPGPWEKGKVKHYPEMHMGDEYTLSRFLITCASAVCICFAFLIKGFSGLFVLFLPFMMWLFSHNRKNMSFFIDMIVMIGCWAVFGIILAIISPDSHVAVSNYIQHQMIGGLLNDQDVRSHFHILGVLFAQMGLAVVVVIITIFFLAKNKHMGAYFHYFKHYDELTADEIRSMRFFYVFVGLGFTGVIPLMFGLKQHSYYLLTVIPCFAIGCGCLVQDSVDKGMAKIGKTGTTIIGIIGVVLLMAGILLNLSSLTKIAFDKELLSDMKVILPELSAGETISVTPEIMADETVANYFYHYKKVSFDTTSQQKHLLTMYSNVNESSALSNYTKMEIPVTQYHLYELADSATMAARAESIIDSAGTEQEVELGSNSDPAVRARSKTLFPEMPKEQMPETPKTKTKTKTDNK